MTNIHDYAILPKGGEEAQQLAYHGGIRGTASAIGDGKK